MDDEEIFNLVQIKDWFWANHRKLSKFMCLISTCARIYV